LFLWRKKREGPPMLFIAAGLALALVVADLLAVSTRKNV
jgi:hypothetical protein